MPLSLRHAAAGALGLLGLGCGAGPATVHPAHTIAEGKVVLGAGVSGNFAGGDMKQKMDRARSLTAGTTTADAEQVFVDGAVADAMIGPGVGPWAGGRVGLGSDWEGDLTYAGRTFRVGGRHAFEKGAWAVSVGGGASVVLLRPGSDAPTPSPTATVGRFEDGVDETSMTGWGLDVPVVAGYRSEGEVVQVWIGARGGLESAAGDLPLVPAQVNDQPLAERAHIEGSRWYAGGLVGLAVGLEPLWVGVQFDAAYQSVSGRVETDDATNALDLNVETSGFTLSPTGVLWAKF